MVSVETSETCPLDAFQATKKAIVATTRMRMTNVRNSVRKGIQPSTIPPSRANKNNFGGGLKTPIGEKTLEIVPLLSLGALCTMLTLACFLRPL